MSDQTPPSGGGNGEQLSFGQVENIDLQEEMERSFLEYAMSVIVMRALPDARDGLKPVHRRILYAMHDQGYRPDRPHVKCARVTGDTMAKYHPHGQQAIYDALTRMAQPFSLLHPLIDFHGNYGSPDFGAAAERYCVIGETRVRTPHGTIRIEDIAESEPNSDVEVDEKVLDRRGNAVRITKLLNSGPQPTLRLRTREGYEITGTPNHPVLCIEAPYGVPMLLWRRLDELSPGSRVAINRTAGTDGPPPADDDRALGVLLGGFVAEGFVSDARAGFNNTDKEYFDQVVAAYDALVGGRRYVYQRQLKSGRTIHELDIQRLESLKASPLNELVGLKSAAKCIPNVVWAGSSELKRTFLAALFEGDGSIGLTTAKNTLVVIYSTRSERLAQDIQQLLLEFGVASRIRTSKTGEIRVLIGNRRDVTLFHRRVGFLGAKQELLTNRLAVLPATRAMSRDRIPYLAEYLRSEAPAGLERWMDRHNVDCVERWVDDRDLILGKLDEEVGDVALSVVEPGYFYAEVASVEYAGVQNVYSVRVDSDDHAFLTAGFVSHNTECRLAQLTTSMLAGIDEDTVDFDANYDGREREPKVLPARFPNLLVNGSEGIAVGMATRIPPHNLAEVIDATVHLIDNPDSTPDQLMEFVKGPDFPTGGVILGRGGIMDAYRTGRGSVKIRGVAEIQEGKRGTQIIISEMPYQTSVGSIANKIKDLVDSRELEGIRDIENLSAGHDTRLVIYLKRDANANVILNKLYKHTPLQTTFPVNMVALVDGVPRTLNLAQALSAYIDHQVEVITRRTQHRLAAAKARAHIVEGLLKALDMIDAIVELIRGSADRGEARTGLMSPPFDFSEIQANHILDMTLARLTRLGRDEYEKEMAQLRETIAELESILADEGKLRGVIKTELGEIREKFSQPRRCPITHDPGDMDAEDLIEDRPVVFVMTKAGYVKTVEADAFRTQARGGRGVQGAKVREEDLVTQITPTSTHAFLLFFSNQGRVFRLKAYEIPVKERTARGTAIVNLLSLRPGEEIAAVIDTRDYPEDRYLFFATKSGQVKKTSFSEYDKSRREGFIAINLKEGDELVRVIQTAGSDDIFMVTRKGQTIRFSEDEVRPLSRGAAGVRGMKLRAGDEVVSCDVAKDDSAILMVTDAGYGKRTQLDKFNRQGRGGQGVIGIKLTAARGSVVSAFMVGLDDEIFLISTAGVTIRTAVRGISSQGRGATGVRVMNLDEGQSVAAVAPILQAPGE